MQAIITKYHGWTDTKPDRYSARCARGSIVVNHQDGLSHEENHLEAAAALCFYFVAEDKVTYGTPPAKNPWSRRRVAGCLPSGDYAHVFIRRHVAARP